jgi:hypothetical protein
MEWIVFGTVIGSFALIGAIQYFDWKRRISREHEENYEFRTIVELADKLDTLATLTAEHDRLIIAMLINVNKDLMNRKMAKDFYDYTNASAILKDLAKLQATNKQTEINFPPTEEEINGQPPIEVPSIINKR